MDEYLIESAQRAVDLEMSKGVAARRKYAIPTKDLQPHEYVTLECAECGADLEEFRLKKGRSRCVDCQEVLERRR